MVITSLNLEQLVTQYSICEKRLVDDYSIRLQMGTSYYEPLPHEGPIVYGSHPEPASVFSERKPVQQHLVLTPGKAVITTSKHRYKMPVDYFGLVQTKGTLARLFVSTTCNDGQIEPGFDGYITLEIVNHSPWTIHIPIASDIAQMYLFKCASPAERPYSGRYSAAAKEGPTIPVFDR
jgi:dCTP deaminase